MARVKRKNIVTNLIILSVVTVMLLVITSLLKHVDRPPADNPLMTYTYQTVYKMDLTTIQKQPINPIQKDLK